MFLRYNLDIKLSCREYDWAPDNAMNLKQIVGFIGYTFEIIVVHGIII
jgi:hypothetical protein